MEPELIEVLISLREAIEILNDSSDSGKYLIWAAIIGASAALIPQGILYLVRSSHEKSDRCLDHTSELYRLTELLRDHFRELAMHKAHKFYWWANYLIMKEKKKSKAREIDRFYDLHMESSKNVRLAELKIADTFASYHKVVIQIQMISGFIKEVDKLIKKYKNHKPTSPQNLDTSNKDLLPHLENVEEDRLKKNYMEFISILENINIIFTDKFKN